MNGLQCRLALVRGNFNVDIDVKTPAEGVTCVLGPSGCGKTTLLRFIAGLFRVAGGRCSFNGQDWQDEACGLFLPPHQRRIGYVFQDTRLFSHLNVRRNIEYGFRRVAPGERRVSIAEAVDWMGVESLLGRHVGELSGGETQRVAMARALVTSPALLLMDEPLSALDEPSRQEILPYLVRLHREQVMPIIYVTHNLAEVARLADYLVCMEAGRVTDSGPAASLLESRVRGLWTSHSEAGFLHVTVMAHREAYHLTEAESPFGLLRLPRVQASVGDVVRVHIGARDVSIGRDKEHDTSILNQVEAVVEGIEERPAGQVMLTLVPPDQPDGPRLFAVITRLSCESLALAPKTQVVARIKGVNLGP